MLLVSFMEQQRLLSDVAAFFNVLIVGIYSEINPRSEIHIYVYVYVCVYI